jgi:hypothetical protein
VIVVYLPALKGAFSMDVKCPKTIDKWNTAL